MQGIDYSVFQTFRQSVFHDLFYKYLFCFSKHYEYCKIEALHIWAIVFQIFSNVLLMILMNLKCQWELITGKNTQFNFVVVMT